jgi:signal transduction histidine kinase/DNA-binding NarL/FixJ family response regulator
LRVLLVEDNPGDAELIRGALEQAHPGTTLVCVERLSEALARAGDGAWDVVLLDLSLPDAFDLTGANRFHASFPDLPIVVLTSREDDRLAARAVAEGAQDYLVKGQIEPSLLLRAVRYAIERQQYGERARLLAAERSARIAAEAAKRRAMLLSEVSGALSESLEEEEATFAAAARVLVPELADWCLVELVDDGGELRLAAAAHRDPSREELLREVAARGPPVAAEPPGAPRVVRTGEPELHADIADEALAAWSRGREGALRALGLGAAMVVPIGARGRRHGAMTFAATSAARRYGPEDLELAREIGHRAGIAVESSRLYREAQRAIRVREDVLAIVSHDLKTPLTSIQLSAAVALRSLGKGGDASAIGRHLETVLRGTRRAQLLLQDLLDMASIRAGRLAIRTSHQGSGSLLAEAVQVHEPFAREKGISLASGGAAGTAVRCDRDRVLQALSNVIANAIKFCGSGDRIELAVGADEQFATFQVADTGPGIADDALPRVFEAYWSNARHAGGGTGLGLFISKGIVEAHGGRMWIESRVGHGTTVRFTIPVAAA